MSERLSDKLNEMMDELTRLRLVESAARKLVDHFRNHSDDDSLGAGVTELEALRAALGEKVEG